MAISTLLGGQFLNHFTSLNAQELREGHRQWISEDPIGFSGRDVNLKRYVSNNVLNAYDPLGLNEKEKPQPTISETILNTFKKIYSDQNIPTNNLSAKIVIKEVYPVTTITTFTLATKPDWEVEGDPGTLQDHLKKLYTDYKKAKDLMKEEGNKNMDDFTAKWKRAFNTYKELLDAGTNNPQRVTVHISYKFKADLIVTNGDKLISSTPLNYTLPATGMFNDTNIQSQLVFTNNGNDIEEYLKAMKELCDDTRTKIQNGSIKVQLPLDTLRSYIPNPYQGIEIIPPAKPGSK